MRYSTVLADEAKKMDIQHAVNTELKASKSLFILGSNCGRD